MLNKFLERLIKFLGKLMIISLLTLQKTKKRCLLHQVFMKILKIWLNGFLSKKILKLSIIILKNLYKKSRPLECWIRIIMKQRKSIMTEEKILEFCKIEKRKCKEISIFLNMNRNTVRAQYLYKMRKEGRIERLVGCYYNTIA